MWRNQIWCGSHFFLSQGDGYGKIHLQITYLPLAYLRSGNITATNDDTNKDDDDDDDDTPSVQQGIVFVLVERGHNLVSGNSGGKTDPYCVLWLADIKKQTEAQKDICDPVWNENFDWPNISCTDTLYLEVEPVRLLKNAWVRLLLLLSLLELTTSRFTQVYDKGAISDKFLGRGSVEMSLLATKFASDDVRTPIKTNIDLEGGKGEIVLRMEWVPLDNNPIVRARSIMSQNLFGECDRGILQVRLVKATDLENMDIIGLSDPYCLLKVRTRFKFTSWIFVSSEKFLCFCPWRIFTWNDLPCL